ncbi:hypothetical protein [Methanobrevibacter sp.]|uniref:hypothetical protein n=1 Tax=Methanobrevibacter sp. TaxID=66852 RepID=UPI003890AD55
MRKMFSENQIKKMSVQAVNEGIESGDVKSPLMILGQYEEQGSGNIALIYPSVERENKDKYVVIAFNTSDGYSTEVEIDFKNGVITYLVSQEEIPLDGASIQLVNIFTGKTIKQLNL